MSIKSTKDLVDDAPMSLADMQAEVARLRAKMLVRTYIVMFRVTPDQSRLPPLMLAHYHWLIDLERQGALFASGPMANRNGSPASGMTVFRTTEFEQAEAWAATDPFCIAGAATYELNRWSVGTGRISVVVNFSDQTVQFD